MNEILLIGLSLLLVLQVLGLWALFRLARNSRGDELLHQIAQLTQSMQAQERRMADELSRNRHEFANQTRDQRKELMEQFQYLSQSLQRQSQNLSLEMSKLSEANEKKLEQMRQTVDEKLQGTLEKRLGESFKQVSERLEQVFKGLGEMQNLAVGVGDLKKVLTNVKTRGTWGEVQLGNLLEQILSPEQYAANVSTKGNAERVEYVIKLPGKSLDLSESVSLPIDAKFPMEDYQRLQEAQDLGDLQGVEQYGKQLELRIKTSAKDIASKYLNPPLTTDFAILFLPTEGLFAEVIRRPGLAEVIQRESRVVLAGPTTLWSILNSLQMGFRTLAIQRRSGEVWNLLGAIKTEWGKYGEALSHVQKKLSEASSSIDKVQTRSNAISRKLKGVQELPLSEAELLLPSLEGLEEDD